MNDFSKRGYPLNNTEYPSYQKGGTHMIENEELPIGFTMQLALHSDALNEFAKLSKTEQQEIINKAHTMHTKSEMRHFVESLFRP